MVITDLIGFGIVMPVLPFYADAFGASALSLGLLFGAYAAAQFVFAPIWGRLSDRHGRRPVLLATIAGTGLAMLGLVFATSLVWLFVARLLAGAFAANISVATAYVGDVTAEGERTRWMGMIGASFGVGFVLGPALGALLSPLGLWVPFAAAAGLSALNWIFALVALPEPGRRADSEEAGPSSRLEVLRRPALLRLCLAYFAFTVGVTQLEVVFAYFVRDRFGWNAQQFGLLLVAMAILMGSIQGGGTRALVKRFGERSLVIGGSLLLGVAFIAIPLTEGLAPLVAVLVLAVVGRAITQPSLMGLASLEAGAGSQGIVMGTFQSSASLARVVGPLVAGLYDLSQIAPFHVAGGLLFGVALLGTALPMAQPQNEAA
ncbi:MAG: MFS transporter [Myxococcota bacterium]|nr:MFS transporter [Myxococcota bacterium]